MRLYFIYLYRQCAIVFLNIFKDIRKNFSEKTLELKEDLKHAYIEIGEQKEKIQILQRTIAEAKQELDQEVKEKSIKLQVNSILSLY